jgi:hypothetical protein
MVSEFYMIGHYVSAALALLLALISFLIAIKGKAKIGYILSIGLVLLAFFELFGILRYLGYGGNMSYEIIQSMFHTLVYVMLLIAIYMLYKTMARMQK